MKKTFFLFIIFYFNLNYGQPYLKDTPGRYFDTLLEFKNFQDDFILKHHVKKIISFDRMKNDTLNVELYNVDGQKQEKIDYSNGIKKNKYLYEYKINSMMYTVFDFKSGEEIESVPKEIWYYKYDTEKNLIYQSAKFKSGNELSFKYNYDKIKNLISQQNFANENLINTLTNKYSDNYLQEYTLKSHNVYNKDVNTIINVKYFYDDEKRIIKIIPSAAKTVGSYKFKYFKSNLVEEIYDTFDNGAGTIMYHYSNGLLIKIEIRENTGGITTTNIFYDSANRVSKTESFNDGHLISRYSFARSDKTLQTSEYFYDKNGFLIQKKMKENDVLTRNFEYIIEYY